MRSHDDLHDLLHDAVDGVHPGGTVDDVLARAGRPTHRWASTMLGVAAATALVIGAVTYLNQGPGTPTATDSTTGAPVDLQVFYLGGPSDDPKLFRETHTVLDGGAPAPVEAVHEALTRPDDQDYRVALPAGTRVGATLENDELTLDLRGTQIEEDPAADPTGTGRLALQALVKTANANSSTPLVVRFTVDGATPPVLLGVALDGPLAPASDDAVLSPVQIDLATQALLADRATVSGRVMAFEATAVWEITDQSGDRVAEGFLTAEECCTLSPFSFKLPQLAPGDYRLSVTESDPSDGEGRTPATDSKEFTIG